MKYRKLPVEVEAMQLTSHTLIEVTQWIHDSPPKPTSWYAHWTNGGDDIIGLTIGTAGTCDRLVLFGDWIIKGVAGEFYPCKPDIFAATYEEAE